MIRTLQKPPLHHPPPPGRHSLPSHSTHPTWEGGSDEGREGGREGEREDNKEGRQGRGRGTIEQTNCQIRTRTHLTPRTPAPATPDIQTPKCHLARLLQCHEHSASREVGSPRGGRKWARNVAARADLNEPFYFPTRRGRLDPSLPQSSPASYSEEKRMTDPKQPTAHSPAHSIACKCLELPG